jgi:[ribosomal protein S5]-alanine N-acetyltransferase
MFSVYGDPEVMRFIPGGPLPDVEAVDALLQQYAREQAERGFSSWAIVERSTDLLVGDVGFGVFKPTGDVELGYTLARACWGRGYATEAAAACLTAGLASLPVPRIIAAVDEENIGSLRVPERIGMARLGPITAYGRPHVLFASFPRREYSTSEACTRKSSDW